MQPSRQDGYKPNVRLKAPFAEWPVVARSGEHPTLQIPSPPCYARLCLWGVAGFPPESACVNICSTAAAIGLATMTMVTIGVMPGRVLGHVAGRRAEMAGGGVVLVGTGSTILAEDLKIFA